MSNVSAKVYTATKTNASTTISAADGYTKVSIIFISGTVTVIGNGTMAGADSTAITLSTTVPGFTIAVDTNQVNGVTITCSSGSYAIIAST